MADSFNPYHRWLGLPEGNLEPNYYELLDVARDERDVDRIAQAADRATTKVRSFRPGPQAALWAKLLDEIQQAKNNLLDAGRRAEYDESLKNARPAVVSPASSPASAHSSPPAAGETRPRESLPAAPASSAFYPPGMGPAPKPKNDEPRPSAPAPAPSPFSSKLYPPGFSPPGQKAAAAEPTPSRSTGNQSPTVPNPAPLATSVVAEESPRIVALSAAPGDESPPLYAMPLGPAAGGAGWDNSIPTATPAYSPEALPQGYIPSAVPVSTNVPAYAAGFPQAIPVAGQLSQPQYQQPQFPQPSYPHPQYPPAQPQYSAPAYVQPQFPGAQPAYAAAGYPAAGMMGAGFPAAAPAYADPYGGSGGPHAYHGGAGAIDPMAPVALPASAAPGMHLPQPMPISQYASAVPVASPAVAAAGGAVVAGSPFAAPVAMGVAVAGAAPAALAQPDAAAAPQIRARAASATTIATRRQKQSQSGLVIGGVAGGLLLLAAALAYVAFTTSGTPVDDPLLAGNSATGPQQVKGTTDDGKTPMNKGSENSPTPRPRAPEPKEKKPDERPMPMPAPMPSPMPMPEPGPSPMPAPIPMSPSTPGPTPPTPAPTPTPPTPTPPVPAPMVKPTREELIALGKALTDARTALGEQNFVEADRSLVKAEMLAKLPEHQAKVGRLKVLAAYVRQFRKAVEDSIKDLEAGETFMVGSSTVVAVVETFPDKIIIRTSGVNKTYLLQDLPPGLAVALVELKLDASDPVTRVVKGAFVVADKRSDSDDIQKAKGWWEEARLGGADIGDLPQVITDSYDFSKEAAEATS